jgi:hypothetical protein
MDAQENPLNRFHHWIMFLALNVMPNMPEEIKPGDCVTIPDGRIARVRESTNQRDI